MLRLSFELVMVELNGKKRKPFPRSCQEYTHRYMKMSSNGRPNQNEIKSPSHTYVYAQNPHPNSTDRKSVV